MKQSELFSEASTPRIREHRVPIYRVSLVREGEIQYSPVFRNSREVADAARKFMGSDLDREQFGVFLLDTRNRLIGFNVVSVGTLSSSLVHPREAFKSAVLANSSAVLFTHNHPSGVPSPSREDDELTRRLCEAGKILGLRVLDHVIIGDGTEEYYSYADSQTLPLP